MVIPGCGEVGGDRSPPRRLLFLSAGVGDDSVGGDKYFGLVEGEDGHGVGKWESHGTRVVTCSE
jgi:hypothetical protein